MRRREFITLLGGAMAVPSIACAQQAERVRHIGILMSIGDDPEGRVRVGAALQELQQLGWVEGRNVRIEIRWGSGAADRIRKYAAELVALTPDVILATGTSSLAAVQQASRTIPIVFVTVTDPVGSGFVASLVRPGGNTTGFAQFEYSMSSKWLELLKQIAPGVVRVGVLRNPAVASGIGQFSAIQSAAQSLSVELSPIDIRDAGEIERAVGEFSRAPNSGLIVTSSAWAVVHRGLITTQAARHKLPAIYFSRSFVAAGGLASYGPNVLDQYRRAAGYVDRILKGERPADLPVQAPTKFELVINLKTAKALGITIPLSVQSRADEMIE
jgi:ABC-type uncharacterized transport system substrate-binding protein